MPSFGSPTPVLRSFDEAKAREFYVDFLGFEVEFEHRFSPEAPLYLGLKRDRMTIHLSEHHGDCAPGARVRVPVEGLRGYAKTLSEKQYKYANPGPPKETPWGELDLSIADPFGNRITFYERPE